MFDLSFSELLVIGIIALIVIGPERMPKVARTVGRLLGRFRRYVADVKSDITQQMQLEELASLKQQIHEQANEIQQSVQKQFSEINDTVQELHQKTETLKNQFSEKVLEQTEKNLDVEKTEEDLNTLQIK